MVSAAKARASRAALEITRGALQMHGAIGYTEEHDIGLYYKRAMTLGARYGGELGHTGALLGAHARSRGSSAVSDVSADTPLLRAIDGRGIATLTFNRPDKGNSYNHAMLDTLLDEVGRLGADPAVRSIVLRGNGKHFSAGAEVGVPPPRRSRARPFPPFASRSIR